MEKGICFHILASNALHGSRVMKEAASFLRAGLAERVILVAKWDPGLLQHQELSPGISVCRVKLATRYLPRRLPWQVFKEMEWRHRVVQLACELRPRTIFCHSVMPLRTAVAAKRATGAALVYDAHELETERIGFNGARKRIAVYLERRFIRQCGAVICVSDSIADWYKQHYGISRPVVVRNIPDVRTQKDFGASNVLRQCFRIPGGDLVFIYQGGLDTGRRVEQMLRIFSRIAAQRHIVFMGYGALEGMVQQAAAVHPNIHFLPAVPPTEVLKHTASADVGVVGVENSCLSYYFSLPNKMFEYLLAGVPPLVPDYPDMRRLVDNHACGWVVGEGDELWVRVIESLSAERVMQAKEKTRAVRSRFSWQNEEAGLFAAHRQAMNASRN